VRGVYLFEKVTSPAVLNKQQGWMSEASSPRLILASASPRRRELLEEAGLTFEIRLPSAEAEGAPQPGEAAPDLVRRLALAKAQDVARLATAADRGKLILACDTVAECGGEILGKPADEADARRMLRLLSGRLHEVHSGLCVQPLDGREPLVRLARTTLRMDLLSDRQIDEYLASGGWAGKAGAFGYQDRLGWVHIVQGSESNVVGLPMELLREMLGDHGHPPRTAV
jgi:septum formation protein